MSRTPLPRSEDASRLVDVNSDALAQDRAAANTLAALQAGEATLRDLINQMLGQAQAFNAIATFSQALHISKLAYVKQEKLYRQLKGMRAPDGKELSGTWDEFCRLLGMSPDKADLDISNLNTFGEAALESMTRMGIGYRDFAQYRKLPADAKTQLIETAKSGDKDAFLDLAEELVERHARQKAELEARLQEATDTLAAKDRVLADTNAQLQTTMEALARPWRPSNPALGARCAEDELTLTALGQAADETAQSTRRLAVVVADICASSSDAGLRTKALQSLEYVVATLREVVVAHGLEVVVSDDALGARPEWMTWQPQASTDSAAMSDRP